jgi:hypothetical protein
MMRILCALIVLVVGQLDQFLVMTLPTLRQVAYIKLPDPTLRVLVLSGLVAPKSLAIDTKMYRLYVTDAAQVKVFWYQLSIVGDKLIQNGQQHIALDGVETNNIAVDGAGNMYFTGKQLVLPPQSPVPGVWKNANIALYTGATKVPSNVYNAGNTGAPAKYAAASGIATDNLNVYWGNAQSGQTAGTIVKAPVGGGTPVALSMEEDNARGIAITPVSVFYTTNEGIHGVAKSKIDSSCSENSCVKVSSEVQDAQGIVWDGDGTVYVADAAQGKIFSFPAGSLEEHKLTEVCSAVRVHGLAFVTVFPTATSFAAYVASMLLFAAL